MAKTLSTTEKEMERAQQQFDAFDKNVKEMTLDTVINNGTKAKPVMKTVRELSQIARANAMIIEGQIVELIAKLNKI